MQNAFDEPTLEKLTLNLRRGREMDQTEKMEALAETFNYLECANEYWGPENFSLLYGTPLWEQSTAAQRVKLNQLYWVAYYSQMISSEIATIFYNQTSAAGLYGIDDFRLVCDTLDLESRQERAHIATFKRICEEFEARVFGRRVFTCPMRTPFAAEIMHNDLSRIEHFWRTLQLKFYSVLTSQNAFIGCQYFTVRGLRALSGKLLQHQLSQFFLRHPERDISPIPAKISYYHFLDESFHFNTSACVSHDVVNSLKSPSDFERLIANRALWLCQRDHYHFSSATPGIFWFDPDLMPKVYDVLRSKIFYMDDEEAKAMMWKCFAHENDGLHASRTTHLTAVDSYKRYLADFKYVAKHNREMSLMVRNSVPRHLRANRQALQRLFGPEKKIGHA